MRSWMTGLAVTAALIAAGPAQATTTISFFGVLTSGVDANGLLGAVNGDLTGRSFSVSYLYDGARLATSTNNNGDPHVPFNYSGTNGLGPITSLSMTIGGTTFISNVVGNNSHSQIALWGAIPAIRQTDHVQVNAGGVSGLYGINAGSFFDDKGFDTIHPDIPFAYAVAPSGRGGGATSFLLFNTLSSKSTYGGGNVESVSFVVNGTGVVPEPATWTLLILGFGTIGVALRRRTARIALT